jgi:ornithine cyclodeaminase/alanine dehydrogenase-like protein (mu-crystallin family)
LDEGRAQRFAEELTTELGIAVDATTDLTAAVRESDVCVTCTPSNRYYLRRRDVAPGTFVAAVGADSEEKQELEPALLAASKVVADVVGQCATIGELHHAVEQGLMTPADVHAELGEVITGRKIGRAHDDEIIVFDSTGMALQDVAAAAIVYERAVRADAGTVVSIDE